MCSSDLIKLNKISKNKVIEIVTDAIWLRDCKIKHVCITDNITFVCKREYSLMIRLNKTLAMYKNIDKIDIRGGRIVTSHPSYRHLMVYLTCLENKETELLRRSYARLRRSLLSEPDKIISSIANTDLVKILKQYAV